MPIIVYPQATAMDIAVFNCNSYSNSFKDKTEDGWVVTRAKTKVSICDHMIMMMATKMMMTITRKIMMMMMTMIMMILTFLIYYNQL